MNAEKCSQTPRTDAVVEPYRNQDKSGELSDALEELCRTLELEINKMKDERNGHESY